MTFIVLMLGIEVVYVNHAREALARQLDAHANETATSLALVIGTRMTTLDPVLINVLVNPVFDRGHFESIEIRGADGKPVFERHLEKAEETAPGWFVDLVALEAPRGESLISARWRQLGSVVVRVYPQYAYRQLWDTALATLQFLSVLFVLALVAMRLYLRGILKPLYQIEDAANAISNLQFVSITDEPAARELQRVTHAINLLSEKVRGAIDAETERAERLRREAFEDPMTGGLNRRGLENTMASLLGDRAQVAGGALALFTLEGLVEINQVLGQARGDAVLRQLADVLAAPGAPDGAISSRWLGPTLATFLPNVPALAAVAWVGKVCAAFSAALGATGLPQNVGIRAGIATFTAVDADLKELARTAERALGRATGAAAGSVVAIELGLEGASGTIVQEVRDAIAEGRVSLVFQKVLSIPEAEVLQTEFMSVLRRRDGQLISAAAFIPVASQYGLLPALDREVVTQVLAACARHAWLPRSVCVNISLQSVLDESFRAWLHEALKADPQTARRIVFEMTGTVASRSSEVARGFSAELRRLGSRFALDNFEVDRNSIALVHELRLAYVKLAPVFTREIGTRDDVRFIVEAVLRAFRPLEIPLIAQGVEDEALVAVLVDIGFAGYQGYVTGRPEPLTDAPGGGPNTSASR